MLDLQHAHSIVILGKPVPLARPRLGKTIVYDSQKVVKAQFAWSVREVMSRKNIPMLRGQIELHIWFQFEWPKTWDSSSIQAAKDNGSWHTNVPDASNLLKFVEDALNGILWEDDCMICNITVTKKYSDKASTIIHCWEIQHAKRA